MLIILESLWMETISWYLIGKLSITTLYYKKSKRWDQKVFLHVSDLRYLFSVIVWFVCRSINRFSLPWAMLPGSCRSVRLSSRFNIHIKNLQFSWNQLHFVIRQDWLTNHFFLRWLKDSQKIISKPRKWPKTLHWNRKKNKQTINQ